MRSVIICCFVTVILFLLCVVVDGKMGRIGGGSMRFAAVVVFIVECVLSHTPGVASGAQSQSLSRLTHLPEGFLRSFAHVVLFFLLAVFSALGFSWWGVGFCAVWCFVDEISKRVVPGRHFSWIDVGLNLAGIVLGILVWAMVR